MKNSSLYANNLTKCETLRNEVLSIYNIWKENKNIEMSAFMVAMHYQLLYPNHRVGVNKTFKDFAMILNVDNELVYLKVSDGNIFAAGL